MVWCQNKTGLTIHILKTIKAFHILVCCRGPMFYDNAIFVERIISSINFTAQGHISGTYIYRPYFLVHFFHSRRRHKKEEE